MSDCVFCKIVNGELPARTVYEDERVVAFWDANPAAPVHILIVPRRHIPTLNDVEDGDPIVSHIADVAKKIAADQGVADRGYRFFINVNKEGGQVIYHLHAHVVAGRHLGTYAIGAAVAISVGWRRLMRLLGRGA